MDSALDWCRQWHRLWPPGPAARLLISFTFCFSFIVTKVIIISKKTSIARDVKLSIAWVEDKVWEFSPCSVTLSLKNMGLMYTWFLSMFICECLLLLYLIVLIKNLGYFHCHVLVYFKLSAAALRRAKRIFFQENQVNVVWRIITKMYCSCGCSNDLVIYVKLPFHFKNCRLDLIAFWL